MSYDNFTVEQLFSDSKVNIICNRIFTYLMEFNAAPLGTDFLITGTVSKIIQGAALTDISVVAFITESTTLFNYCSIQLPKLINAQAFLLKNRVQINYKGIYIEVWLTSSVGASTKIDNFNVQTTANIPSNIK